jgi:hypothetical protein
VVRLKRKCDREASKNEAAYAPKGLSSHWKKKLLALCSTPKLKEHLLSAAQNCLIQHTYWQRPSLSSGHILNPQSEDAPYHGDERLDMNVIIFAPLTALELSRSVIILCMTKK